MTINTNVLVTKLNRALADAMEAYLRTCSSGGMPKGQSDTLKAQFLEMLARDYAAIAIAPILGPLVEAKTRLEGLRNICGYVENGSDTVVKLYQDDATKTWTVAVGTDNSVYGDSLGEALDLAIAKFKSID